MAISAFAVGGPGNGRVDGKTIHFSKIKLSPAGMTTDGEVMSGGKMIGVKMKGVAGRLKATVAYKDWKPSECMAIQGKTIDLQDIQGNPVTLKNCHYVGQPEHDFEEGEWEAEFLYETAD